MVYIHNIKTTTITTRNNQSICIDFSTTCHRKYYIFMYENKHYRLYEKNIILYVFREVHLSGHHTAYFWINFKAHSHRIIQIIFSLWLREEGKSIKRVGNFFQALCGGQEFWGSTMQKIFLALINHRRKIIKLKGLISWMGKIKWKILDAFKIEANKKSPKRAKNSLQNYFWNKF